MLLVLASWVGFAFGHGAGQVMEIDALAIGPINTLSAALGSLIGIALVAVITSRWSKQLNIK